MAFASGRRVRPSSAPVTRRPSPTEFSSAFPKPSSAPASFSRRPPPIETQTATSGISTAWSGRSSPSAAAPSQSSRSSLSSIAASTSQHRPPTTVPSEPRTPATVDVLANSLAEPTLIPTLLEAESPEVTTRPERSTNVSRTTVKPSRSPNSASSNAPKSLRELHYATMRRQAVDRAERQRDRENDIDREMEEHLAEYRRSTSSSRNRRPQSAPLQTSQRPNVEGHGSCSASWNTRTSSVGGGPSASGYAASPARRPFTAIAGYAGCVPRKVSDSIPGCSFYRGNMRARAAFLAERLAVAECW